MATPTRAQVRVVAAVVEWYLRLYHRTDDDPGTAASFADPLRVGAFAITSAGIEAENDDELFRLLFATTMFQRRQDVQILRVLRGIRGSDASELTSPRRLLKLADASPCDHLRTTRSLHDACDLAKHPVTREGTCNANRNVPCHLKRHTVLLRRYGHFGKVPTSAALAIREAGTRGLSGLRRRVFAETSDPQDRALRLEAELSKAWRVSSKIAAMFLSALAVPDMSAMPVPWKEGLDWTRFVVVDSNVDLFLDSIGYDGAKTYEARREFVRSVARRVRLNELRHGLEPFNPRLVQQAMYLFMSATNRRAIRRDCSHYAPSACTSCPRVLRTRCPAR